MIRQSSYPVRDEYSLKTASCPTLMESDPVINETFCSTINYQITGNFLLDLYQVDYLKFSSNDHRMFKLKCIKKGASYGRYEI